MKEFIINNWDKIFLILTFLFGIYQFYKTQSGKVEIKKLESRLELAKDKNILNDKKFREAYEGFISIMLDMIKKKVPEKQVEKAIMEFIKKTLLFAGPKTVKAFGLYRKEAGKKDSKDILMYTENLIYAMREDLGVSNEKLEQYDILQVFILGDAKEIIEKGK